MKFLKRVFAVVLALWAAGYVVSIFIYRLPQFGGEISGERLERVKNSPEFAGARFENKPPQSKNNEWFKTIEYYMQGQIREPSHPVPVIEVTPEDMAAPAMSGMSARWLGHATVLVEIEGVRILTDPVLSDRVSPFPVGPERLHPSPLKMEELRDVDAVLISHDHYDHLDMPTVQTLAERGSHFYVPLAIGAHLERWGIKPEQIHEMEWWQTAEVKGVGIHCTPARHYSGRKKMDNSTLWSSWLVKGKAHSFYFSGDTGYSPHFQQIKSRLGAVQLTLMKVGAYGDPEAWNDIHMNPESAVRAQIDLGAEVLLPVHWATFNLAYHAWNEPVLRTLAAAKDQNFKVITPRIGEKFIFGDPFESQAWYE